MKPGRSTRALLHLSFLFICCVTLAAEYQFFPKENDSPFRRNSYPKFLLTMGEQSLYERRSQPGIEYRFLHLPHNHKPSAMRITRTKNGAELRIIRLDGMAGYGAGKIEEQRTRVLDEAQWKHFLSLLDKASFWDLPERENYQRGIHGSMWVMEGRADGRYRALDRWTPKFEMTERKLEAFVACCDYLWELAGFSKEPKDGGYY